uniref:PUM-HD domain-containing protein n=1 Tax=Ganoderma boninense TaxID=34458 RepID=A0A5K1JZS1_9APHY|nr:PUM-HD domain-containing protein [Ganoderma boninense]
MHSTDITGSSATLSLSPKHVLLSEVLSVTSMMRRNSRWALSTPSYPSRDPALASSLGLRISKIAPNTYHSGRGNTEQELMAGFQDLKRLVKDIEDVHSLPLSTLLSPFLAIIRSSLSTGPITSTALTALHNFFLCGLFSPASVSLQATLAELSSSLSSCKFEASDSSGDEVVLLKIMTVISDAMCGSIGRTLGDIEICEMLETVLTTSCQMRLSEILRRSAEGTLHQLVRTVFARLHELDPEAEEQKVADVDDSEGGEMKMSVSTTGPVVQSQETSPPGEQDGSIPEGNEVQAPEESVPPEQLEERQPETPSAPRIPYGLPSILELLRVLINILDPNDQAHTDSTRLTALRTLNVALEATGARICAYPSLSALILDHGCKFLFQLARSDHPVVLQSSLRAITTMFETMRPKLKLQHELFLAFTIDRLTPAPITKEFDSEPEGVG